MAPETYYYCFSIIFAVSSLLYLADLVLLRLRGKTFFGQSFKPGTREYMNVIRLGRSRNIAIAIVLVLVFVLNLLHNIQRLLDINTSETRGLLLFAPIFILVLSAIIFYRSFVIYKTTDKPKGRRR